jgi:hypothetical protein
MPVLIEILVAAHFAGYVVRGFRMLLPAVAVFRPSVETIRLGHRSDLVDERVETFEVCLLACHHGVSPPSAVHLSLPAPHRRRGGRAVGIHVDAVLACGKYAERQVRRVGLYHVVVIHVARVEDHRALGQSHL